MTVYFDEYNCKLHGQRTVGQRLTDCHKKFLDNASLSRFPAPGHHITEGLSFNFDVTIN